MQDGRLQWRRVWGSRKLQGLQPQFFRPQALHACKNMIKSLGCIPPTQEASGPSPKNIVILVVTGILSGGGYLDPKKILHWSRKK